MDPEAIKKEIHEAINQAMPAAIEKHVNGHIRELRAELQPVIDGMKFVTTARRFLLWFSPMVAALGAIWGTIKLLR